MPPSPLKPALKDFSEAVVQEGIVISQHEIMKIKMETDLKDDILLLKCETQAADTRAQLCNACYLKVTQGPLQAAFLGR